MIQADRGLAAAIEYLLDTRKPFEKRLHGGDPRRLTDVHVGDLVVGDGKGIARARVEGIRAQLVADGKQPGFAQGAVDVYRSRDVYETVLGKHDDPPPSATPADVTCGMLNGSQHQRPKFPVHARLLSCLATSGVSMDLFMT